MSFPNLDNPLNLFRTLVRPGLAPLVRTLAPSLAGRVYVSGIRQQVWRPKAFARAARGLELEVLGGRTHGYWPIPFSHHLPRFALLLYEAAEHLELAAGSNVVVLLRRPSPGYAAR